MTAQDIKYLLECIRKDNHAIVVAYLKHSLSEDEKLFWKAIKQLVTKKPEMVTAYLQNEETLEYFAKHDLPDPREGLSKLKIA